MDAATIICVGDVYVTRTQSDVYSLNEITTHTSTTTTATTTTTTIIVIIIDESDFLRSRAHVP
jgi:hypothetical protein